MNAKTSQEMIEDTKSKWLEIIAEWANREGISFDATARLDALLEKDEIPEAFCK